MWLTTIVVNNRFSDRFAGTFCGRIIFKCLGFCFFCYCLYSVTIKVRKEIVYPDS